MVRQECYRHIHHSPGTPAAASMHALAPAQDAADSKLEAGTQLTYTHGRPDVRGILKHMKKEYDHLSEIDVYAAGKAA